MNAIFYLRIVCEELGKLLCYEASVEFPPQVGSHVLLPGFAAPRAVRNVVAVIGPAAEQARDLFVTLEPEECASRADMLTRRARYAAKGWRRFSSDEFTPRTSPLD